MLSLLLGLAMVVTLVGVLLVFGVAWHLLDEWWDRKRYRARFTGENQ